MTTTQHGVSFAHQFVDRVRRTPAAEAFRYRDGSGWQSLTWQDTRTRVWELAAGLVDLGVAVGERVGIASGTRIEWIVADLAVMCAGAATTTVYPTTAADEVGYIVGDSGCVVVIAEDAGQVAKLRESELPQLRAVVVIEPAADVTAPDGVDVLTLQELAARGRDLLARRPDAVDERVDALTPDHLATLVYTSGTTGRPKGVRLSHANWTYEGRAVAELDLLTPADLQYLWLPLSHVLGKMLIGIQLEIGFATAVDGDLSRIVENLGQVKPTFMGGAPRIFEKVRATVTLRTQGHGGIQARIFDWAFRVGLAASRTRQRRAPVDRWTAARLTVADALVFRKIRAAMGGRIRFFVSGSAPLSREVAEWFDAAGLTVLEGYGLTETSAACAVNLPQDTRIGTVGPPLPGTEFMIASDGEILVRGGGVMTGYHGLPEATDDVLDPDGWLHTGDIGELSDGYLRVTDRKKDMIKTSGGKYVSPQKIEGVFKAVFPYASHIVVHGESRRFASALITLDPDAMKGWADQHGLGALDMAELSRHPAVQELVQSGVDELNSRLERWETIKKFVVLARDLSVEAGELTPSMKVRRRTVENQYVQELDELYR
ncbi:AMP-dependent synthetase/ligase [Nakamurella endophytica]|uniref:Acyl-CoA synthetase n=1 Tax=Nakamurella endophytica TaxID=1748367 RepID=A0A917SMC9_9ACTN|nr:long-chain fatty acid--CoA ligase [Nakamurella endophytica]GGL87944.1 AMP-dependent synthetase [Nakamurella endophytica]